MTLHCHIQNFKTSWQQRMLIDWLISFFLYLFIYLTFYSYKHNLALSGIPVSCWECSVLDSEGRKELTGKSYKQHVAIIKPESCFWAKCRCHHFISLTQHFVVLFGIFFREHYIHNWPLDAKLDNYLIS